MAEATAKYLEENIGPLLARALAEMTIAQPVDGVDFLAQWLKTYAQEEDAKIPREQEEARLAEERGKMRQRLDDREVTKQTKRSAVEAKTKAVEELVVKFNNPEVAFLDGFWNELVDVVQRLSGAKAVYLGLMDEEGLIDQEAPLIRYTHTSVGSEWMLDKVLPKEAGVTFGALKEKPSEEEMKELLLWQPYQDPPPPPPEDGEDAPPPPEGPPYLPVHVPCVTDVDRVHYFDLTRLGSYLAVPLVHDSYHNLASLEDAVKFREEERAEQQRLAEEAEAKAAELAAAAANGETAGEEGEGAEEGEEAAAEEEEQPPEEKEMILSSTPVKLVLCLDTLGTNVLLDQALFPTLIDLCKACGDCKARTEKKQVDEQAIHSIDQEKRQAQEDEVARVRAESEASLQERQEAEKSELNLQDMDPDVKTASEELLQKKFQFLKAQLTVVGMKDVLCELSKIWVAIPTDALSIIASTAFMVGHTWDQVYPKNKNILNWVKLQSLMDEGFFNAIKAADVAGPRKGLQAYAKLSAVKDLLPSGFDAEKAKELSPAFETMHNYITSAIEYREKDLEVRKLSYEARKKLAEEADPPEPFTEKPLVEQDDDFVE